MSVHIAVLCTVCSARVSLSVDRLSQVDDAQVNNAARQGLLVLLPSDRFTMPVNTALQGLRAGWEDVVRLWTVMFPTRPTRLPYESSRKS